MGFVKKLFGRAVYPSGKKLARIKRLEIAGKRMAEKSEREYQAAVRLAKDPHLKVEDVAKGLGVTVGKRIRLAAIIYNNMLQAGKSEESARVFVRGFLKHERSFTAERLHAYRKAVERIISKKISPTDYFYGMREIRDWMKDLGWEREEK